MRQRYIPYTLVAFVLALTLLLWRAGFFSSDTLAFALPASEVQDRLSHAGLPPLVFGERPPDFEVQAQPGQVNWLILEDGSETMRYVADIRPTDATHSEVHVGLQGVSAGRFGDVDARIRGDRSLRNLYVTAMKEQVRAVLDNRPFRYTAINYAGVVATGAHLRQISRWMDDAAEAQHKRERENVEKAYRDAGVD
jgi:hypothetical protein